MTTQVVPIIDEVVLFNDVSEIIERQKFRAQVKINREGILMFWEVGKHIGSVLLGGERAEYGKRIVVPLAQQLKVKYGSSFDYTIKNPPDFTRPAFLYSLDNNSSKKHTNRYAKQA